MPRNSIVNKATGQVCHPAEKKNGWGKKKQHKSKWNRLLQTQDMYLQFIRSNMGPTAIDTILAVG